MGGDTRKFSWGPEKLDLLVRKYQTQCVGRTSRLLGPILLTAFASAIALWNAGCSGVVSQSHASPPPPSPAITTSSLPAGQLGAAYQATLSASGGATPYSWSLASGSLPGGLSLSSASGAISGMPSASGTSSFTVQVTDSGSKTAQQPLSIAISGSNAPLSVATVSLAGGQTGQPYLVTLQATGGTPSYSWSITSGQLPAGLALGPASGQISGTPTTSGQFNFTVQVQDSESPAHTSSQALGIAVSASSAQLDAFGGLAAAPCAGGPRSLFYVEKETKRWWFCTPAGHRFWVQGIFDIVNDDVTDWLGTNDNTLVLAKYGTRSTWAAQVLLRMQNWNFNTVGEQGTFDGLHATSGPSILMPFTGFAWLSHYSALNRNNYAPGPAKAFPPGLKASVAGLSGALNAGIQGIDPFDPNYATFAQGWFHNEPATKAWYSAANNQYMIGWIVDDADSVGYAKAGMDFPTVRDSTPETGHGSSAPHFGFLTLLSAPNHTVDTSLRNQDLNGDILYSDPQFYAKSELATWLQGTADKGPGYGTISALNTAWGSGYTSFTTTSSPFSDTLGTGNGSQTTFSFTLTHTPVTPCGIVVTVGGVAAAGDDCTGPVASPATNLGNFRGNVNVASSTINYSSGAITIVFSTPPPSTAPIVVSYRTGGWGSGTGIWDEDGTCPAKVSATCWLPTDAWTLAGSNVTASFKIDMDNFLFHLANKYFSTNKAAISSVDSGRLYMCTTGLGGWGAPARRQVYQAAALSCDVLSENTIPTSVASDDQGRVDFVAQWGGDKPWIEWAGIEARADSYEGTAGNPNGPTATIVAHQTTQAARGTAFANMIKQFQTMADTSSGTFHVSGYRFWQFYDSRGEGDNWGLVSLRDNVYNGTEACNVAGSVDAWGFPISPETQLPVGACYGDFISTVRSVNQLWLTLP